MADTKTGAILAAVGLDGSGRETAPERVLSEQVQPWSLAKPALVAVALEQGLTTPDTEYDTNELTVLDSGEVVRDYEALGLLTTRDVIVKSSNVGAVQIGRRVGNAAAKAGMSGLHLDGIGGTNSTDVADIAVGRGQVSPLALLRAYEAMGGDGQLIVEPARGCGERPVVERVMSSQTSAAMWEMLRRVVEQGTGRQAASDYQPVGGKTATGPNGAAFIAVMPRVAVWVLLEDGEGLVGGQHAAPLARDILDAVQASSILPGC